MRLYGATLAVAIAVAATPVWAQGRALPSGADARDANDASLRSRLAGPRLAHDLSGPSISRRVAAADALGREGAPRLAVDALIDALPRESARQVRAAIVRSLARRGDSRAVAPLIEALAETRGPDAAAALSALAVFGTGDAIDALVTALGDPYLQRFAVDGLIRVGAKAVPLIAAQLGESTSPISLLEVLGRIGSPLATPALLDALPTSEPLVRAAALRALARIGDPRAARAALTALDDADPSVERAAIDAVAATASRADARRLERLRSGPPETDAALLGALLRLDAARVAARLLEQRPTPGLAAAVLEHPHPELLAVYARLAEVPEVIDSYGPALYAAIAAVGDDDAIALLARFAIDRPAARDAIAIELALALERMRTPIGPRSRDRALEAIRAVENAPTKLLLLAIAGDSGAGDAIDAALTGHEPELRAAAALALATTNTECRPETVRALARDGGDPELFRRMAEAAVRCGVRARATVFRPYFYSDEAGPEAMAWAAISSRDAAPAARRALGRDLREALRSPAIRLRAGAARALAILGDRTAHRAIARLLDDRDPGVRRAAARALEVLGPGSQKLELEAAARVETDPALRAAFEDAARSAGGGNVRFDRRGRGHHRLERAPHGVRIDLVDAVGRHRRFEPAGSTVFLVVGLPDGPIRPTVAVPPSSSGATSGPAGSLAPPQVGP